MPRVSRERAGINRRAITEASARLIRERGIGGVSVADLMGAAGLTHGGFYGHFDSKPALAAEACALAFARSVERWSTSIAAAGDAESARRSLIEGYLSPEARANPGTACPASSLAGDVAREAPDSPVREAYRSGVAALVDLLAGLQRADRQSALADLSTLVGALMLARATQGAAISDEILAGARARLLAAAAQPHLDTSPHRCGV